MSNSITRREALKVSASAALMSAIPGFALAGESASSEGFLQGGTNPVIKIPNEIEARTGGALRIMIYPSANDSPGDTYEVRALELSILKNSEGKIVINEKHQGIDGIENKEFASTVTVKDAETPMIATIKLDYISGATANRVIAIGAFNERRSGIATVMLKKV